MRLAAYQSHSAVCLADISPRPAAFMRTGAFLMTSISASTAVGGSPGRVDFMPPTMRRAISVKKPSWVMGRGAGDLRHAHFGAHVAGKVGDGAAAQPHHRAAAALQSDQNDAQRALVGDEGQRGRRRFRPRGRPCRHSSTMRLPTISLTMASVTITSFLLRPSRSTTAGSSESAPGRMTVSPMGFVWVCPQAQAKECFLWMSPVNDLVIFPPKTAQPAGRAELRLPGGLAGRGLGPLQNRRAESRFSEQRRLQDAFDRI